MSFFGIVIEGGEKAELGVPPGTELILTQAVYEPGPKGSLQLFVNTENADGNPIRIMVCSLDKNQRSQM